MKKIVSLIKACMTDNMSLFRIKNKNKSEKKQKLVAIFLTIMCFIAIGTYADMIMESLATVNGEIVLLLLFVLLTTIMTLIEGVYKSSGLLFNCRDDNLLLSLPIKKSTVVFIRILKFYVFELLYNSLFLLPAMFVYITYVKVGITFYLVSFIALLLLPVIPIAVSCIIGMFISAFSSRFKLKNFVQIIITMIFLLLVFYISFNLQNIMGNIAQNSTAINNAITQIYYPARAYIQLVTNFNMWDLCIFIIVNILIFMVLIAILSKGYFKINSRVKAVKTRNKNTDYKIKTNKPIKALIKKELNRFVSTPVFIINAGFGLVLFIVICVAGCFNFDSILQGFSDMEMGISMEQIKSYLPVILFGLVCFSSLMTSITSSMISLEGKSFSILKSLPITPYKIVVSKVLSAVLIMIPFLLIGDLMVFIKFQFNILEALLIILASVILPFVSETIGILVNLKYPKMDAENDTEVVKQSMSSMISVFIGMFLTGLTIYILVLALNNNIAGNLIILYGIAFYFVLCLGLLLYLNKKTEKLFKKII